MNIFKILLTIIIFSNGLWAISPKDKSILKENEVYMFLSSHVYELENKKSTQIIGLNPYLGIWNDAKDWKIIEYRDNSINGFTAAIYKNDINRKITPKHKSVLGLVNTSYIIINLQY